MEQHEDPVERESRLITNYLKQKMKKIAWKDIFYIIIRFQRENVKDAAHNFNNVSK